MRLRPHHLLCLLNFVGEGYDGAFCANMSAQKRRFAETARFTLADGMDDICEACPNRRGRFCAFQDKVRRYDRSVCAILGIVPAMRYDAAALEARVRQEIFEPHRLREVCGDCEWYSLCAGLIGEKKEGTPV